MSNVSPEHYDVAGDEGCRLGRLWLYIDHPHSERQFYCTYDQTLDEVRVLEWWGNDCVPHSPDELEPALLEELRRFCSASDDVAERMQRYREAV